MWIPNPNSYKYFPMFTCLLLNKVLTEECILMDKEDCDTFNLSFNESMRSQNQLPIKDLKMLMFAYQLPISFFQLNVIVNNV